MNPLDLTRSIIESRPQVIGSRLILHAGTPKTGTTSMQFFLNEQRRALRQQGILYPRSGLEGMRIPKHQWLHHFIYRKFDEEQFAHYFAGALDEAGGDTVTIVFSTEAIFNHWWDYGEEARNMLSLLGRYFDIRCLVWLREPVSFFKSYYLQCLKNPHDGRAYGCDLFASEMLRVEWVRQHLHYEKFLHDAEQVFGAGRVYAFAYDGDTVEKLKQLLSLGGLPAPELRNASLASSLAVSILRQVNGTNLNPHQKGEVVRLISEIDKITSHSSPDFDLDPDTIRIIRETCTMTKEDIIKIDLISTTRWHSS